MRMEPSTPCSWRRCLIGLRTLNKRLSLSSSQLYFSKSWRDGPITRNRPVGRNRRPVDPIATAVTPLLLAASYRQQRPRSEPEVDAEQADRRAIVAKSRIAKVLAERRGDGDVLGNLVLECDHRLRRRIRDPDAGEVASA